MTSPQQDEYHRRPHVQRRPIGGHVIRGLWSGLVGGLVATTLMTLYRYPVFRALPPTADFWGRYVAGGEPERYPATGLLLHVGYGVLAGGLFGAGFSLLDVRRERDRGLAAIGLSLVYGLVLSVVGTQVVFRHLLEEELEPSEAVIFHAGHVIYGLTLGTWIGTGERSGAVYE